MEKVRVDETFDFAATEIPKDTKYLQPGHYKLVISEVEYVQPDGVKTGTMEKKTPYLAIKFEGKEGQMTEKFFLTPKAIDRLQYLHLMLFDKKCDRSFASSDLLAAYFEKVFMHKKIEKMYCVGGKETNTGKVYACFPYSNYILPDKMDIDEGPFEKGSANWNMFVTKDKNLSTTTNDVILPDSDTKEGDPLVDLPF